MRRRRLRTLKTSSASASDSSQKSLVSFHAPSLGDKLQMLAGMSPKLLRVVEIVVDELIRRVNDGELES
jgi:hypothetical protein